MNSQAIYAEADALIATLRDDFAENVRQALDHLIQRDGIGPDEYLREARKYVAHFSPQGLKPSPKPSVNAPQSKAPVAEAAASATKPEPPARVAEEANQSIRQRSRREKKEFFQLSNKFFDWSLKMPPVYRLLWACLHREANGRPGREARVQITRLGEKCNLKRDTVRQGIAYLAHVDAIHVLAEPKRAKGKHWKPGVYYVPPVSNLDPVELAERIDNIPRPLRKLRPDEKRRGMRKPENPGHGPQESKPVSGSYFDAQTRESGA